MPTTSVRSARLVLKPSLIAQILEWFITLFLVWALLISPVPIVASVYLIFTYCLFIEKLPKTHSSGVLKVSQDGTFELNQQTYTFKVADITFKPLLIVIYSDSGKRVKVWRDSCPEPEYRHLLVVLDLLRKKKRGEQTSPL
ncbi:protein YgfX [Vibrio sp. HN007]|uniref:protein YgfX n=1 Tax=Vibrio iocasae TaxID=3098914 RepID=UPI0035D4D41D